MQVVKNGAIKLQFSDVKVSVMQLPACALFPLGKEQTRQTNLLGTVGRPLSALCSWQELDPSTDRLSDNATSGVQTEVRVIRTSRWSCIGGGGRRFVLRERRKEEGRWVDRRFSRGGRKAAVSVGTVRFLVYKTGTKV